jgi:death on curing protein
MVDYLALVKIDHWLQPLYRIDNYITYEGVRDPYEIAAYYAIAIAQGHTFNDGNKRTAMTSMMNFLLCNDLYLETTNTEIEDMMVNIAEKKITQKSLVAWLRKRSHAVTA